jgi:hypothetical protein
MPRDGAIIFSDLMGKLDVLRIERAKCGRFGRYHVYKLVERYGADAKLFEWSDELLANCARKLAGNTSDLCGAVCPDLSKVL